VKEVALLLRFCVESSLETRQDVKGGQPKDRGILLKPLSIMAAVTLSWISAFAAANKAAPRYVVTNDDVSQQILNSATFYSVAAGGTLSPTVTVSTRGDGIAGGFLWSQADRCVPQRQDRMCVRIQCSDWQHRGDFGKDPHN
jgi:hypothetical protein